MALFPVFQVSLARDVLSVDCAEGIHWNQIIVQIQQTVSFLSSFGAIQMKPLEDASIGTFNGNINNVGCVLTVTC
ncbi:hypothetical protein [Crenothrix sp.]|uniref:hypothetical protein n=1 Tax=Crenothrix sp. TaxID=3100433 RepID=UPI00374CCF08